MPRIPETEIARIKEETDLVALIQSRGVALKQQGTNWTGFCPFHDDQENPNLIVTPGKGLWRCMAACCGATGNVIQFVERFDGLSFRHAFEVLANGGKAALSKTCQTKYKKALALWKFEARKGHGCCKFTEAFLGALGGIG